MARMKLNQFSIIFLAFLIIFLSGCQHTIKRKDGPPNFYVDETKIPNEVPRRIRLSKYGNKSFYSVFGKRYRVMKSCKNYHEIGTASWYGTMYHRRATSSGERYNMLAMTAAHKSLPLPTFVEVTNLSNHRKIIVKVNDRGPFVGDRIIDLSYVAAKKLGMTGTGTAKVELRAIDPETWGKPHLVAIKRTRNKTVTTKIMKRSLATQLVYLQVGAFRSKANAEKLKNRLAGLFNTPVEISYPSNKIKLYRVKVGPIRSIAMVNKIAQQLKDLGIQSNKTNGV